jgi:hypothetical protein
LCLIEGGGDESTRQPKAAGFDKFVWNKFGRTERSGVRPEGV